MAMTRERQGELLITTSALLWGLFPVVTILSYQSLSPLLSLALSTLISSVFFGLIVLVRRTGYQMKDKQALRDILWMTLILGIVFYVLYFFGLRYTSAGNASIIALTETFFSYVFFNVWRAEYISSRHIAGALLAILGAVIILSPGFERFMWGDTLVLTAAMVAPLGNFFQRRARQRVSSEVIWFVRSILAGVVLLTLAYVFGGEVTLPMTLGTWWVLLLNGVVIFGVSKFLWIESITRISVTKANALSALSVIITLLFAWFMLHQLPTMVQLLACIPMFVGVRFLSSNQAEVSGKTAVASV